MSPPPKPLCLPRLLLAALALGAAALVGDEPPAPPAPERMPIVAKDTEGYALPDPRVALAFPRDHGSHPSFRSEWWYLTAHARSRRDGQRFGLQLTFFRSAGSPPAADGQPSEEQIHMAHAAVLDLAADRYRHEERLNREGWNARSAVGRLDAFNGNWSWRMTDPDTEAMRARFSVNGDYRVALELRPLKSKTLFGDEGYSRKGADREAASYYVSFTRLALSGNIEVGGENHSIEGLAWMDHEFSSSHLSQGQIGWNWTSLILDDGSELMAYVMRRADGHTDPHSTLALVDPDGNKTELKGDAFSWQPLRHWESPATGARYPVDCRIVWRGPEGRQRSVVVKTLRDSQELRGSLSGFDYWEGAGEAFDASGARIGQAYTELTGYAESLAGRF